MVHPCCEHSFPQAMLGGSMQQWNAIPKKRLTDVVAPEVFERDVAVPPAEQVEVLSVQDAGVLAPRPGNPIDAFPSGFGKNSNKSKIVFLESVQSKHQSSLISCHAKNWPS